MQEFIWDGSHLVQEIQPQLGKTYSYIYRSPNSYEPLAQLEWSKNSKNLTACYYYHTDQIGIPRELTDENGELCWYGDYTGWGKLKNEYALVENIHQPFRLQNQYADEETGLHYNFFHYYEPNVGRFTQLDPIGLAGGDNLYGLANNAQKFIDPLGLMPILIGIGTSAGVMGSGAVIGSNDSGFDFDAPLITDNEIKGMTIFLTYTVAYGLTKNISLANEVNKIGACSKASECPSCTPYPAGTIGYQGPESHSTGIFAGESHYHIFVVNQNPSTCECRWNKGNKKQWGHQYFGMIDPTWINLNSSPKRPPDYPH